MVSFIGRSGFHTLFAKDDHGVIVDSRCGVVVASGATSVLTDSRNWGDGEFSELDEQSAALALETLVQPTAEPTGRLYTVPRGVQNEARKALALYEQYGRGATDAGIRTASILSTGGQIDFNRLANIQAYFSRHSNSEFSLEREPNSDGTPSNGEIAWKLRGGDTANRWASTIIDREAVTASTGLTESLETLDEILASNPEATPEFIARVRSDGSGIDRLYRIDLDGHCYVWDDGMWEDMGRTDGDIWVYDRELDEYGDRHLDEPVERTHTIIDPDSAIQIASRFAKHPDERVHIEDIHPLEARLIEDAVADIDWEVLDQTLTAAGGTPGDGIYTPEERSENATVQVRDATGRFAKTGVHVISDDNQAISGEIIKIDGVTKMATVKQDAGGTIVVPVNSTKPGARPVGTIPSTTPELPKVDFSGILGEPRTPINRKQAQIPGTLPAMTADDLHKVINHFPAWVKAQRDAFSGPGKSPAKVGVTTKNSTDIGKDGRDLENTVGKKLTLDAYDHPLLNKWLNRKSPAGYYENKLWYRPITAAVGGEVTPDNSDVQPVYMAIVSPDDPRAVFKLISLVPASATSNSPAVYSREEGEWTRDDQTLNDLNSATPPPVVPLDSDTLDQVLVQVDESQGVDEEETPTEEPDAAVPTEAAAPAAPVAPVAEAAPETPVAASAFNLMVLWGPRQDFMDAAITAAGGADRNRGGAEKLRRYWTVGPGGAKIAWGSAGDWTRCVRHLGKFLGPRAKGYCALRHKEMTGMWTGDAENRQAFSAKTGGTIYSDIMVASVDEIVSDSALRARAQLVKDRIAVTASATPAPLAVIYEDTENIPVGITAAISPVGAAFRIPLALPEGTESGDKRILDVGAATIRNLPVALLWQFKTADGHQGSVVVGRIEQLERVDGGIGNGYGHFDTGVWGREAERMVRAGMLRHVSADMDMFEAVQVTEPSAEAADKDDDGNDKEKGREKIVINQARVMAVTIVAKPAFQECTIELVESPAMSDDLDEVPDGIYVDEVNPLDAAALVAAGYIADHIPLAPPANWFDNPALSGPTPLTVDDTGRVFGHIASWDMDHIGMAGNTRPPRSKSNYAYFHSGVVRTEEGHDVHVGQITLAGGHAGLNASAREAVKHYDDTGSAFADVHVGEDEYGIWAAGALRPEVYPEQIRAIRAAAPSGDWRPIRGKLELVAVCQVNVPGFPIARARVASGHVMALTAAGAMTLAKMKSDPLTELSTRLEALEQFSTANLKAQAAAISERFAPARAEQEAALTARYEAASARLAEFGFVPKKAREDAAKKGEALPDGSFPIRNEKDLKNAIQAYGRSKEEDRAAVRKHIQKRARALGKADLIPEDWKNAGSEAITASVASMRERIASRQAEFASDPTDLEEKRIRELLAKRGQGVGDGGSPKAPNAEDSRVKYTPKTQPRDYQGQFRDVLARLKENLGVGGNQAVIEKLEATEKYGNTGDYAKAAKSAVDLKSTIDRMDKGALDKDAIGNIRDATTDLANVIANLPLPFDNQAQKVRYSDLPPALRDLIDDFISQVENKLGAKEAASAVGPLKSFKSGGDVFAQGEINQQLNVLLRLLT